MQECKDAEPDVLFVGDSMIQLMQQFDVSLFRVLYVLVILIVLLLCGCSDGSCPCIFVYLFFFLILIYLPSFYNSVR